jgi:hypothetical protein
MVGWLRQMWAPTCGLNYTHMVLGTYMHFSPPAPEADGSPAFSSPTFRGKRFQPRAEWAGAGTGPPRFLALFGGPPGLQPLGMILQPLCSSLHMAMALPASQHDMGALPRQSQGTDA